MLGNTGKKTAVANYLDLDRSLVRLSQARFTEQVHCKFWWLAYQSTLTITDSDYFALTCFVYL